MKIKNVIWCFCLPLLALTGCNGEENSSSSTSELPPSFDSEREPFTDPILEENMENFLKGFRMSGNIIQKRYEGSYSSSGEPLLDAEPYATNTYYTDVAFNSYRENAFYKFSWRELEGTQVDVEGPFTFFEDEEGITYQEEINYKNEVVRNYSTVGGDNLTFGDNGFYNFFSIFQEEDFVKNENVTVYTRYDLSIDKAAIIANNLLYSVNSGGFAVPTSAYIRVDNGVFTSLSMELSPIASVDNITGATSFIKNSVLFSFSHIGEETILHASPYEEKEENKDLEEALNTLGSSSFTMDIVNSYQYSDLASGNSETRNEVTTFAFTGKEIYVHESGEALSDFDKNKDYYLAPYSEVDQSLYPYAYEEESDSWTLRNEGFLLEDGTIQYAQGYCGIYTYQDLYPIFAEISGVFFEKNENNVYESLDDITALTSCFLINHSPYRIKGSEGISSIQISLNNDGSIAEIRLPYSYLDNIIGDMRVGTITLTFSLIGNTTLEGIIGA